MPCSRALELWLRAYQPPASGYLFPSPINSDGHITLRGMDNAFRRALARGGMENQGYTLYSPRRGFITELHRAGYDVHVIQALTGHRSLSMLSCYIEVSQQQQQSAVDSLD